MNPRVLVAMDTNEKLHVIDVRSEEELEVQCLFLIQETDRNCILNKTKPLKKPGRNHALQWNTGKQGENK